MEKKHWKNVYKLINYLGDNEKEYYADEYIHREKMERRNLNLLLLRKTY